MHYKKTNRSRIRGTVCCYYDYTRGTESITIIMTLQGRCKKYAIAVHLRAVDNDFLKIIVIFIYQGNHLYLKKMMLFKL